MQSQPEPIVEGDICETKANLLDALEHALFDKNTSLASMLSNKTQNTTDTTITHTTVNTRHCSTSLLCRTNGPNRCHGVYYPTIVCSTRPTGRSAKWATKVSNISSLSPGIDSIQDMPALLQFHMIPIEQKNRAAYSIEVSADAPLKIQPPFDSPPNEPLQWALAVIFPLPLKWKISSETRPFRNRSREPHRVPEEDLDRWRLLCAEKQRQWQKVKKTRRKHWIEKLLKHLEEYVDPDIRKRFTGVTSSSTEDSDDEDMHDEDMQDEDMHDEPEATLNVLREASYVPDPQLGDIPPSPGFGDVSFASNSAGPGFTSFPQPAEIYSAA